LEKLTLGAKFSVINIRFVSEAKKFLKKCPEELRELFKQELSVIYDNIEAGIPLTGDLSGCYKIKITYGDNKYRAVYDVLSDTDVVVVYCGPRSNAYQIIKKSGVLTGKTRQRKKR